MKKIIDIILYKLRYLIYALVKNVETEKEQKKKDKTFKRIRCKGDNVLLNGDIVITEPLMLSLGNNVSIETGGFIVSDGGVIIGDNTHIEKGITINTITKNYEGSALPFDPIKSFKPVYIEKNVCIRMNVTISAGVTIGEGSVIGDGAVITEDIPPYSIVEGRSIAIIGQRNITLYNQLKTEQKFVEANGNLIKDYHTRNAFDFGENLFFILSTGRSGSTSISKILSQNAAVKCEHESKGLLNLISTQYEHGLISKSELKLALIKIYSNLSNVTDKHYLFYGESDQKLSNMIDVLHEIFPKAKFIWLIRKGKDVVDSTYHKGWFHDDDYKFPVRTDLNVAKRKAAVKLYSNYRLDGSKIKNEFSEQEWKVLTPFERNCWYWVYWNKRIENQFKNLLENLSLKITLENLETDIHKITAFIGAPKYDYKVEKYNEANYVKYDWTEDMNIAYHKICANYEAQLYALE